jgi:hypothetical protein
MREKKKEKSTGAPSGKPKVPIDARPKTARPKTPSALPSLVKPKKTQSSTDVPKLEPPPEMSKGCLLGVESHTVYCWLPNFGDRAFQFEGVFDGRNDQRSVYERVARSVAQQALHGFNSTLFVYGQTGSGKTYSMFGDNMFETVNGHVRRREQNDPSKFGIVPRACLHILESLKSDKGTVFTLQASYVEIYLNNISDLLAKGKPVQLADMGNSKFVLHSTKMPINDINSVWEMLALGELQKQMFATAMNARSSRSHCVFTLYLHQSNPKNKSITLDSTYHMVDLAGSERVKKSLATGKRMEEAQEINKSLSTLERCILKLSEKMMEDQKLKSRKGLNGKENKKTGKEPKVTKEEKSEFHVPFRDSELTKLLAESLGGNSQTTMLVTCRTDGDQIQETLSTMRFAERAATIKNVVNKKNVIGELMEQIAKSRIIVDSKRSNLSERALNDARRMWQLRQDIDAEMIQNREEKRNKEAVKLVGEALRSKMEELPLITQLRNEFADIAAGYTENELKNFASIQALEAKIKTLEKKVRDAQITGGGL